MANLKFSIVIPTYNRNDLLELCLSHLQIALQDIDSNIYEVIVTDDGKVNTAQAFMNENYPWATWVEGPHIGPAANRNNGVRLAKGEWIIFTDDDCLPQKDWVKEYLKYLDDSSITVLEGKTITDRPQERYDEVAPINLTGGKLWSCNFALRKSLFDTIGGFDVSFPHSTMEDIDFQTRILKVVRPKFIPDALIVHPWRQRVAFKHFRKRLLSQQFYAHKYGLTKTGNFRFTRFKIFVGVMLFDIKSLFKYKMRGWGVYIERCCFEFCMIFI